MWECVLKVLFLTTSFILTGSEKPSRKPGGPQPSGEPEDPQQGRNSHTCQHEHMNSLWPSWHTLLPVSLILVSRVKEGGIYEIYGVFVGWQQANNTFWLFTWLSLEVFPSQLFLLLLRENEHKWLNFELPSSLRCWTSVTAYLCLRLHLLCAWTTSLKIITPAFWRQQDWRWGHFCYLMSLLLFFNANLCGVCLLCCLILSSLFKSST